MSADKGRAWNVGAAGRALRLAADNDTQNAVWQDFALCQEFDPALWYHDDDSNYDEAKAICARCSVASMCLEYALARESGDSAFGVWGGLSPKERRNLRRRRRQAA